MPTEDICRGRATRAAPGRRRLLLSVREHDVGVLVNVDASVTGPKEDTMSQMLDAAGRRRSPATLPDFLAGRPPRNKGLRYPAAPPTVEEIGLHESRGGSRVLRGARSLIDEQRGCSNLFG
jgi:hypothetical protein